MAKKTTQEILDMTYGELNRLTPKELKSLVSQVAGTANKRLDRLREKGINSYAYEKANKSGGRFGIRSAKAVRPKVRQSEELGKPDLMRELARARQFLNMKTSTLQGAKRAARYADEEHGGEMTKDESSRFWGLYNRLNELYGNEIIKQYLGSGDTERLVDEYMQEGLSDDEILERMQEKIEESYIKAQEELAENEYNEFTDPGSEHYNPLLP